MNILRNVRWGFVGNEMVRAPWGSDYVVELVVETSDNELTFVRVDRGDFSAMATFSKYSTFDQYLYTEKDWDTNVSIGWGSSASKYNYGAQDETDNKSVEFEMGGLKEQGITKHPMYSVINLGLIMMTKAHEYHIPTDERGPVEYDGARKFAKEWLNKDLDKCDIPLFEKEDEEEGKEE